MVDEEDLLQHRGRRDLAGRATLTWTIRFQVASFEKTERAVRKQATVLDRDDTPARWRWREWH